MRTVKTLQHGTTKGLQMKAVKTMDKLDRLLSKVIQDLWLWDLSRNQKRQSKETERQMKKRGYTTYQELWADEDYKAELIVKAHYAAQAADKDFQEETAKRMARRRKPTSWDDNR